MKLEMKRETDDLGLIIWDEKKEDALMVGEDIDHKEAAKMLACSEELIDALVLLINNIKEHVGDDLNDLYNKST